MKNLFKLLSKYKRMVTVLLVILMVQAYCDLTMPEYVRKIIDEGIMADPVDLGRIQTCGAMMIALVAVMFAASAFVSFVASRIGASIGKELRSEVYGRVLDFSESDVESFGAASLITRTTNDIQQIQLVITMLLRMLLYAPVIGIYGVVKVWRTGTGMGWIILLALLVVTGLVLLLMSLTIPKFKRMQPLMDVLNRVSREILTGLPVVRAFGNEKFEEKRFDDANRALTENQLFTNKVMSLMQPAMMLLTNVMVALITWVAAHNIAAGDMKVGQMTAFITYSITIVLSFLFMSMMSIMLPRAGVSADRIREVLDREPSIKDPACAAEDEAANGVAAAQREDEAEGGARTGEQPGAIAFEHVSFRYPGADEDAVSDVTFRVEPGESVGIIGSTGSGKSTLISMIPRFYDATDGTVRVGGADVKTVPLKELRKGISFVPQKSVLFTGTIESNIRFGNETLDPAGVKEAAEIAMAADFIEEKPDGYRSFISQGGGNVSGGQKQRLSIARAVAADPKILILDDSFSALDMKTDAALRKALAEKLPGVTRLIVTQRISTVMNCDRILVLDEGKVAGSGSHRDLLASCGIYREIAESQLSKAELGA